MPVFPGFVLEQRYQRLVEVFAELVEFLDIGIELGFGVAYAISQQIQPFRGIQIVCETL